MLRRIAAIFLIGFLALAYQAIHPPPPRTCGSSPEGPLITGPRIKLRDGRHIAYKEHGAPREEAKKKIVFLHGFGSSRHDAVIATHLPQVHIYLLLVRFIYDLFYNNCRIEIRNYDLMYTTQTSYH